MEADRSAAWWRHDCRLSVRELPSETLVCDHCGARKPSAAPVRLCCGQRHYGALCPDGKVMCCLCFGRFDVADLSKTVDGDKQDVCLECYENERRGRELSAANSVAPHPFRRRRGWRFWLCTHCYAPRKLHPRRGWVRSRPLGDHTYLSPDAPHFKEGW